MARIRVGFGYDVHQLVSGRKLFIGGVEIPHQKGALGHSDADVLLHAITDAMLGAAGLDDIGNFFPDNNPKYKDTESRVFVAKVMEMITEKGFEVGNVDITVVLQNPKIQEYIPAMKKQVASLLKVDITDISIKATTSEKLGFIGKEDGLAAYAVVLLSQK
jgi:2-C-methyl-D-erythritol 2,4-cyclodiphosphate synthase